MKFLKGIEKRQSYAIPLLSILLSLVATSVMLLLMNRNPLTALSALLQGTGFMPKNSYAAMRSPLTDFIDFLNMLTPMLFAAMAVAVAFKAGLFNIGVSGQMLVSGFVATVLVGYSDLPMAAALPLVVLVGIIVGALAGGIIGLLKYKFNINEVVSSIMLNYIIMYVVSFFISLYFLDPVTRQSTYVNAAARLTLYDMELGGFKYNIPLGFLLAVPTVFIVRFMLNKTNLGYEIKTVGLSRGAARYAGINVGRNMVTAMVLSGALAGLAGVTYYLGYVSSIQPRALAGMGFDAIAVSLLGNSNPIGIVFSSILITVVTKGGTYLSMTADVSREIASVITGLILLFSACGEFVKYLIKRAIDKAEHTARETEGESANG